MSKTISGQTVLEWAYSAKAMRPQAVGYGLITLGVLILLIVVGSLLRQAPETVRKVSETAETAGVDLDVPKISDETATRVSGYAVGALWTLGLLALAALWGRFAYTFFYRTKTLRYVLDSKRINVSQGFGTPSRKAIDLVTVEDISWESSPWERLLGCETGTVTVAANARNNTTKTYVLTLSGLENPEEVFETVNKARLDVRAREGITSVRGT